MVLFEFNEKSALFTPQSKNAPQKIMTWVEAKNYIKELQNKFNKSARILTNMDAIHIAENLFEAKRNNNTKIKTGTNQYWISLDGQKDGFMTMFNRNGMRTSMQAYAFHTGVQAPAALVQPVFEIPSTEVGCNLAR